MKNKKELLNKISSTIIFAIFLALITKFISEKGAGIFFIIVSVLLLFTALFIFIEIKKSKKK